MINILVAEDDRNLRRLMCAYLIGEGYQTFQAENGLEALEVIDREHIDLMITDIMMPDMDGYELLADLRAADYTLPVMMVTAKESFEDKRQGFEVGADDYMVKPVDMNELLLRVAALLRRAQISNQHRLDVGGVLLDSDALTVTRGTESILLPKKEFYLLFKLLSYPHKIFTRHQLMDEIWGMDAEADERTVDVHIKRLREKFAGFSEFEIVTVRGLGYKAEKNG